MKIKNRFEISFLAFALLFQSTSSIGLCQENSKTAQKIVKQMATKYATCYSYQDSGIVVITDINERGRKRIEKKPFSTYFRRPQLSRFEEVPSFLFEWFEDKERYAVWCDGEQTYTSFSDRYERRESLGMGLAGATGISSGAAHTIPRLLMKDVGGFGLTDLTNLMLLGIKETNEGECYLITGEHPRAGTWEMWIGKHDYLLHKLRYRYEFKNFVSITEQIHKRMKIDEDIPDKIFHYRP